MSAFFVAGWFVLAAALMLRAMNRARLPPRPAGPVAEEVGGCQALVESVEGGEVRVTVRPPASAPAGSREPDARTAFEWLRDQGASAADGALTWQGWASPKEARFTAKVMAALCSRLGAEALESVAEAPGRDRALALRWLLALHPYRSCGAAVVRALHSGDQEMARIAVAAVVAAKDAAQFDSVAALADDASGALAVAVAGALVPLGGARAEPALIKLLRREPAEARAAAAAGLAEVGSIAAVEALHAAAHGAARHAAEAAIARIQERSGGEGGALSLPAADEGLLSLADDPQGALSIAPAHVKG